jgi:acetylornithine deacetylase/succinyl-diaminopimelate desuccinylase-like protein
MGTRDGALGRAATFFDDGRFKALLARLVEIPSTAQEPGFEPELDRYLNQAIRPWVEGMGFTVSVHPNPLPGFGPIMTAERIEDPARPTVLLYGHRLDD